ncbi:hypothetical protein MKX03_034043, partial [Papaver bracteatum]
MLSRFISRSYTSSHLRFLTLISSSSNSNSFISTSSNPISQNLNLHPFFLSRYFS